MSVWLDQFNEHLFMLMLSSWCYLLDIICLMLFSWCYLVDIIRSISSVRFVCLVCFWRMATRTELQTLKTGNRLNALDSIEWNFKNWLELKRQIYRSLGNTKWVLLNECDWTAHQDNSMPTSTNWLSSDLAVRTTAILLVKWHLKRMFVLLTQ